MRGRILLAVIVALSAVAAIIPAAFAGKAPSGDRRPACCPTCRRRSPRT